MTEIILTQARLVLRDEVVAGTVVIRGGTIAEVQPGRSHLPGALDLGGDHLIPGVVDVHTDNLERQVMPRANARWPGRSALLAHDAQCAAAGVTTVLDALCLGDLGFDPGRGQTCRDGLRDITALAPDGLFKAEHFLHLRCELPAPDLMPALDLAAGNPLVRMVSLMDHSPGVGQYRDIERYKDMRMRQKNLQVAEVETRIGELLDQRARLREPQRREVLARYVPLGIPLASHDDEDAGQVAANAADGILISEFPVTMEAAVAARPLGVQVIGGAPNIVRGGSHSGNVAVADLVREGAVDALASDYVPAALVEAAWRAAAAGHVTLPQAVAMVTDVPARMVRLPDRGRIAAGLRADLARIASLGDMPFVRQVWRAGERVA
ncbi:alpha-D-ribose 1-methylphosphonate 5-triphosphate diphosphatase [Paracraurococcus ruber]|uniref:Phosphonate metabolism protein PhnM n=1 Tax=Paracraurococcus ruber TaxID=77675 RepID=A0ABS1CQM2_9PROT|nr:alpha-D-ribose 1-methylphosphonate 5-triphosphate diphosphatase [Paracraurococcus ruber]MBK1656741.1 phosphonate metabolism protein PhnM [Paracraurococcus ruber]TDG30121.1 alpha-D-ribose 1-methylphosphonate 5-triphosphate diphosphatase [Paracraurococcus ruber]